MVFQNPVLVDWRTVLGNVLLQVDLRGLQRRDYLAPARELLASVGLGEFAERYPYELSGGMQQRTAFCRALIHDPPLILMDEPLGALDALTREQLRADLERLWMHKKKTVILVTHSIEEAVQLVGPGGRDLAAPRPDGARPRDRAAAAAHARGLRDAAISRPRRRDPTHLLRLRGDLSRLGSAPAARLTDRTAHACVKREPGGPAPDHCRDC